MACGFPCQFGGTAETHPDIQTRHHMGPEVLTSHVKSIPTRPGFHACANNKQLKKNTVKKTTTSRTDYFGGKKQNTQNANKIWCMGGRENSAI